MRRRLSATTAMSISMPLSWSDRSHWPDRAYRSYGGYWCDRNRHPWPNRRNRCHGGNRPCWRSYRTHRSYR